jgi:hypothetical protein
MDDQRTMVQAGPEPQTKKPLAAKATKGKGAKGRGVAGRGRAPSEPKAKKPQAVKATRANKAKAAEGRGVAGRGGNPSPPRGPSALESVPKSAQAASRRCPPRPWPSQAPDTNEPAAPDIEVPSGPPLLSRSEALEVLVLRANNGSTSALDSLRQLMDRCPEVWQHVGDLTKHAELAWTDLMGGGNYLIMESVKRQVAYLKSELAGTNPTSLEKLLVEQAALTWLASRYAEMAAAKPGKSSLAEGKMMLKRAESTQRRHLASLKMLAELRVLSTRSEKRSVAP